MRIVFATGGTGGHINPALAVAGELRRRRPDAQILFIGTPDHMESRLVPQAGFDFKTIEIEGFQRKPTIQNLVKNIKDVELLLKSTGAAKAILREFAPDVAVGFGGYVSGPVIRTAGKMGIKTAIHEQNAYPGVTNKALAKTADKVMLTVEAAKAHLNCKNEPVVTGLPVRHEIIEADRAFARAELGVPEGACMILSMGGSLGAKAVNEAVCALISNRYTNRNLFFMHATGKYGKWVPDALRENGLQKRGHPRIHRQYGRLSCGGGFGDRARGRVVAVGNRSDGQSLYFDPFAQRRGKSSVPQRHGIGRAGRGKNPGRKGSHPRCADGYGR